MKAKRKLLKDDRGFTLIELIIVIALLGITMIPIYRNVVGGAKIQKASEETYEATLQSQSLLQSLKGQIEEDLTNEYKIKRKTGGATDLKDWLKGPDDMGNPPSIDSSLVHFLYGPEPDASKAAEKLAWEVKTKDFHTKFKTGNFLYEVHIWPLENGELKKDDKGNVKLPISFLEYGGVTKPTFTQDNTAGFTMVEINNATKDYFAYKDDILLWTNPADKDKPAIKAIGEIRGKAAKSDADKDQIEIRGNGIESSVESLASPAMGNVTPITGYEKIKSRVKLKYERYETSGNFTHRLVIENGVDGSIKYGDLIQLGVDLNSFTGGDTPNTTVIRIENNTKGKVIVPVYDDLGGTGIQIFPIQHKADLKDPDGKYGSITVEKRKRKEPGKNFVVGVIVRDAYNSTFGEKNKILSKIVDVYSYDYNKQ